jgi:hypothetical protein
VSGITLFDLLHATQQHLSERWFRSSHSLSPLRSLKVSKFSTSMCYVFDFIRKIGIYPISGFASA